MKSTLKRLIDGILHIIGGGLISYTLLQSRIMDIIISDWCIRSYSGTYATTTKT